MNKLTKHLNFPGGREQFFGVILAAALTVPSTDTIPPTLLSRKAVCLEFTLHMKYSTMEYMQLRETFNIVELFSVSTLIQKTQDSQVDSLPYNLGVAFYQLCGLEQVTEPLGTYKMRQIPLALFTLGAGKKAQGGTKCNTLCTL